MGIFGIFELIPEFSGEVLAQERLGTLGEDWIARQILRLLEMRSAFYLLFCSRSRSLSCWLSTTTKLLFFGDHSFDTIVHILYQVNLRSAESPLVRNIVNGVSRLGVLTVDTSDLHMILVSNGLELVHLCTQFGQLDVN